MVTLRKRLSTLTVAAALTLAALANSVTVAPVLHFYPDDPIRVEPSPLPVHNPKPQDIDDFADFLVQSVRPNPRPPTPSLAVNTLGEVPDSLWYINRHASHRMSIAELQRGPGSDRAPVPPFVVAGAKTQGITPGFRMRDSKGRLYFVKPDPQSNPEMATAADVIGSKFFYALGYFTPENYIVEMRPEDLSISEQAMITGASGKPRHMQKRDLDEIFERVPRTRRGAYRFMASLKVDGQSMGPFRYEGTRSDDPNDIIPHERRRDLRGLSVFCAWLNHTDAKGGNSLDTLIEQDGIPVIRHHLIDFGAILGSDSDMPKNPRFGHEFIIPPGHTVGTAIVAFGLDVKPWETARFPHIPAVGNIEAATFVPEQWHSNYPNPAFLSAQPGDRFWAAKQIMAFTEQDIRALVETGQFSDPQAVDYLTRVLVERRDKIGRAYLSKGLALDGFKVQNGRLQFEDLAAKYGVAARRARQIAWSRYDNETGRSQPLTGASDFTLPRARTGEYYRASISSGGDRIDLYVRAAASGFEVVGIQRSL
jgi:hypothetical protein